MKTTMGALALLGAAALLPRTWSPAAMAGGREERRSNGRSERASRPRSRN